MVDGGRFARNGPGGGCKISRVALAAARAAVARPSASQPDLRQSPIALTATTFAPVTIFLRRAFQLLGYSCEEFEMGRL
jgi:hypothetical protein